MCSLDELLGLEVASQIEHLPHRQTQQAAHAEDAKVQDFRVGRF